MGKSTGILFFVASAGVLAGGACIALSWWMQGQACYHDFRGQPLPTAVRPSGPQVGKFLTIEPQGMRINLPKDRKDLSQVGFSVKFEMEGDFEATATVEILDADTPRGGYGVGATMGVDDKARVGRYVRANDEQVVLWDFWPVMDGKRTMQGKASPCVAKVLRMRLKRSGDQLRFLWSAETTGEDFEELHATDYDTEKTRFFTMVAESSGQPCAVDIRVVDFRIRSISGAAQVVRWTGTGLGALGLVSVALMAGWHWRRSRPLPPAAIARPPRPMANESGDKGPDNPEPAKSFELRCPKCKKRFRVPAHLAGKKVKCNGCAESFLAEQTP